MNLVFVPNWLRAPIQRNKVEMGVLLDVKKLLSILSKEDVAFYCLAQNMASHILPEALGTDFGIRHPGSDITDPYNAGEEVMNLFSHIAHLEESLTIREPLTESRWVQPPEQLAFELLMDGPGTFYSDSFFHGEVSRGPDVLRPGKVPFEVIDEAPGVIFLTIKHPCLDRMEDLQTMTASYDALISVVRKYYSLSETAQTKTFEDYERLLARLRRCGELHKAA